MSKRSFNVFFTLIIGLMFILGDVFFVCAQETKSDEFTLEEITVTAAKRAENQQKVAIAMETITGDSIKELGKNDLGDILNYVANAVINKAQDGLRVSLRGMSDISAPFHGQSVSMPTVAVNMDGVYSNRKDTGSGLFDIERVEVLYGPQSTLYASNSPGGIVNVVTANPKLDKYEISGLLEYGNFNLLHTEGTLNAPISEKLAMRAAFSTAIRDGYLSNGGDNEDSKNARVRLLYQPSDKLTFVVTGELSKTSSQMMAGVAAFNDDKYKDGTKVKDYWYSADTLGAPSKTTSKGILGRMDWSLGIGTLSILPSYTKRDGGGEQIMNMFGQSNDWHMTNTGNEKSLEVRMASASDFFFKWLVGVNYYKATDFQGGTDYVGGVVNGQWRKTWMNELNKAVYANITYPFTDKFRATGGYRWSWDNIDNMNIEVSNPLLPVTPDPHADKYSAPDYKVGVEYDLGTNSMLYADYATSYRVQGMGGGGGPPGAGGSAKRPPEKLYAYSAGAKNRFLDNKLQLNASAFYYDYSNFSAGDMVTEWFGWDLYGINPALAMSDMTTSQDSKVRPWGDGHMYGVDITTNAILSPQDLLNLSVSYMKSEWTNLVFNYTYSYQAVGFMPPPPGGGPGATVPITVIPLNTVNYNGKPMMSSPKFTVTLSYSHNFNLANGATIKAGIDSRYKTAYKLSWKDRDFPWNNQEATHISNLSLGYTNADGKWTLTGYVKNLENYAEKRGYFGDPINQTTIGPPRTYGGVLSVKF
jgi:iron complex outermembrane recepter protein